MAEPVEGLPRMFDEALHMVDCAIQSFVGQDGALGQKVCETDAVVDSLAVLKIAGNLERIADLATNIGEDVMYMAEGRQIKHHREETP